MRCPECQTTLTQVRHKIGLAWKCDAGHGLVMAFAPLRRVVTHEFISGLWRQTFESRPTGSRPCPACQKPMRLVAGTGPNPAGSGGQPVPDLNLDVCPACSMVWFDADEFSHVPKRPPESEPAPLPPAAAEAVALAELEAHDSTRHEWEEAEWWVSLLDFLITLPGNPTRR